jgi:hypothetical protein
MADYALLKQQTCLNACARYATRSRSPWQQAFMYVLQEACDLLQAAQQSEAGLFASQQPPASSATISSQNSKPLQPKILCRTPNSVTLTHFPLCVRGYKQPASFAVYCKHTGAGVALSINSTAMEYPGALEK